MKFTIQQIEHLCNVIRNDQLAVIPTDTIYGIVASASTNKALRNLRKVKQRGADKAFIVLISSFEHMESFGVPKGALAAAREYWPGPVSIVLKAPLASSQLNGNLEGVAFRMPDDPDIVELLEKTGPLAAPSANPDSQPPAETIDQAQKYFGKSVSLYIDAGKIAGKPSTLIKISDNGTVTTIRK